MGHKKKGNWIRYCRDHQSGWLDDDSKVYVGWAKWVMRPAFVCTMQILVQTQNNQVTKILSKINLSIHETS